jgi:hypothetical protein
MWRMAGCLLMEMFSHALAQASLEKASRWRGQMPEEVIQQCLSSMVQVPHLPGRYLENTDHLKKGVNP